MEFKNLSKTFRYINEENQEIIFDYGKGFLINKPKGIDTVEISLSRSKGINQVGETVQSKNVQPRPVSINGILTGDFQADDKEKLLSVIRPDLKAKLYADDYYLEVIPTSTPNIEPVKEFAHFNFNMLAPYPYWQHDEKVKIALSGLSYKFKFPRNFARPWRYAEFIETKFINVVNRGQMPTPFTVTIFSRGSCTNPKITNVVTGKFMEIKKEMTAGERIVVEITHDKTTVVSSIDGDIRGALTLKSNLFELNVGDNVLKPEAESGLNQLEITISFATEKVGISL